LNFLKKSKSLRSTEKSDIRDRKIIKISGKKAFFDER